MKTENYLYLASQFLRLAHESSIELVNSGNLISVTSEKVPSSKNINEKIRWVDHSIGIAILFNYFHGIELTLKMFLYAIKEAPQKNERHKLTILLKIFLTHYSNTELGSTLSSQILNIDLRTPLGKFLSNNSITIDDWYQALKYPEINNGQEIDHFDLKYGGQKSLSFWREISNTSSAIYSQAYSLAQTCNFI